MSAPDLTATMMRRLADSGADKHITLLLGAGASITSGLPGWNELAVRLLLRSASVNDRAAAELLVERQDPLLVAEAARRALGTRWERSLQGALYEGVGGASPSALHTAAAGHALGAPASNTTLVTLNFDALLEAALHDGGASRVASGVDGSEASGIHTVHHLHGLVTSDTVEGAVLALSDFNDLLGDPGSWQLRLLRDSVRRGALIIAGTSYRDPDVRQWLHVALHEQPEEHAALVLLARQGFNVPKADFAKIEMALADQWRAVGLTPVVMEEHADAAQILRELRHLHDDGYLSPQERARMVWDAHAEAFDRLQAPYSDRLDADASTLRRALDVEKLNLSLWIADGRGRLVRWAAQDRRYRDLSGLRSVESGYDSPWVAGRALAEESVFFQDLEAPLIRRWNTVLAVPIRVEHSGLPEFVTAVMTVGLTGTAADYDSSSAIWLGSILRIANDWSALLVECLDVAPSPTLTSRRRASCHRSEAASKTSGTGSIASTE